MSELDGMRDNVEDSERTAKQVKTFEQQSHEGGGRIPPYQHLAIDDGMHYMLACTEPEASEHARGNWNWNWPAQTQR